MENKLPAVTRRFLPFAGVQRFRQDFRAFVQAADELMAERAREAGALGHVAEMCGECKERIVGQGCACFRYPFTERENEARITQLHASLSADFPPRSADR